MLVLYTSKATSFSNLGLGILKDLKSDPLITEELNGSFILEFEYIKNGFLSEKLIEGNLIKCDNQLFRIKNITKSLANGDSIKILAQQYFQFDMSKNFLSDVAPTKLSGVNALKWIVDRAEVETDFVIGGDCTNVSSARYVRKNVSDAIYNADNSLLSRFGGELEFNLKNVYLHQKRGSNKGFSIRYRKNLKGLEFNLDFSTVVTKICPQGANELLLDDLYVSSPRINNYFQPFFQKVDFNNIGVDDETTEAEAKEQLKKSALELFSQGIDLPEISIKVDFVELSKCTEYKQYQNLEFCSLGDTIRVIIPEFDIDTSVRVVKTVYNDSLKRLTSLELGTAAKNIISSQTSAIKEIENAIENPVNILASAKKEATKLINHPFKGNLFIDEKTGILYLIDTNDINTAKNVWKWSMGGLGFSSNGVNGEFITAITQNGSIVADFITTGKLNTNLIEGYDNLLIDVSKIKDVTRTITANNYIEITDAVKGQIINFSIKGDLSLFFLSNKTFLGNNTFFKNSKLIIEDSSGNKKEIETNLKKLNSLNNAFDEFVIDDTGTYIIRKIGVNSDLSLYILEKEKIESLPLIKLELNEGYNKIYMKSFSNLTYTLKYAKKNDYTDIFATKIEMNSSITMNNQNIDLKLLKKTDKENIIAQINMSTEKNEDGSLIQIESDKLNIKNKKFNLLSDQIEMESPNFSVTKEGKIKSTSGEIGGFELNDICFHTHVEDSYTYTKDDADRVLAIVKGSTATEEEKQLYDLDEDGKITRLDYTIILRKVYGYESTKGDFYIYSNDPRYMIRAIGNGTKNKPTKIGLSMVSTTEYYGCRGNFTNFDDSTSQTIIDGGQVSCVALTQTSLEQNKKNFEEFTNALEEIKKTDIYKYNLKSENDTKKKHLGFVIGDNYNYSHEITSVDEDGKEIGVDSYSMTSLCLQAIKEQQLLIEALQIKIKKLEEKSNGTNS